MELAGKVARATLTSLLMMLMVVGVPGGGSSSCTPSSLTVEAIMHYSDVVVFGKVVRTSPEPGDPRVYRAHMVVYCIFKGHDVPRVIDIWEAGNVTEPCSALQMEVGEKYVAYLYQHAPSVYTPAYPHHSEQYKEEMYVVCDLNVTLPTGDLPVGEEVSVTCEDRNPHYELDDDSYDYKEENCIRYTPKAGDPAQRMKKPRNLSGKTVTEKVEGEGDGESSDSSAGSVSTSLLLSSALALSAAGCTLLLLL